MAACLRCVECRKPSVHGPLFPECLARTWEAMLDFTFQPPRFEELQNDHSGEILLHESRLWDEPPKSGFDVIRSEDGMEESREAQE